MSQQSYPCETCKLRAQYDKNPKSLIGDLKEYMESGQWKADYEADEKGEGA